MRLKLEKVMSLIFGCPFMPGWKETVNKLGEKMLIKNFKLPDNTVKCIGVCRDYAIIFAVPYENSLDFLDKPQCYLIVMDKKSLSLHLNMSDTAEVLEAFRRIQLAVNKT